jgi:hypothetical protein
MSEKSKKLIEVMKQQSCTRADNINRGNLLAAGEGARQAAADFKKMAREMTLTLPMVWRLTERPVGASAVSTFVIVFGIHLTRFALESEFLCNRPELKNVAVSLVRKFGWGPSEELYQDFAARLRPRFIQTRYTDAEFLAFIEAFLMLFKRCLDDDQVPATLQRRHWRHRNHKSHPRTVLCTAFAFEFVRPVITALARQNAPTKASLGMRAVFKTEVLRAYFVDLANSMESRAKLENIRLGLSRSFPPAPQKSAAVSRLWNSVGEKMRTQIIKINGFSDWIEPVGIP